MASFDRARTRTFTRAFTSTVFGMLATLVACSYPTATFLGETTTGVGGQGGGGGGTGGVLTTVSTGPCTDADQDGVCVETGDCNDGDPNVRPGQTAYFTSPRPDDGSFDYNCNGADDKEFEATCSPSAPCPAPAGFQMDTACGKSGGFGACTAAPVLPTCVVQDMTDRIQACQ